MIRLTTLGAARVHSGDTAFPDLPAQRLRFALLIYLAVEQDVSREEVVAMFWPDRDTARGKHALRQMLYELRQVLGEGWIEMRRDRIVARASVDVAEFEAAVEEGRVTEALRLYGGPFLLGFSLDNRSFEGWVDRRSAHLARLHRRLQRDYIAQLVADGRTDDALAAAREWVELDALDDEAAHTLIERLVEAGERTAALHFYDSYERQLAAELQVEPLENTRALIAAIRNGEIVSPQAEIPRQPGVAETAVTPAAPAPPSAASAHSAPASAHSAPADVDRRKRAMRGRSNPVAFWRTATRVQRSLAIAAMVTVVIAIIGFISLPTASPARAAHDVTIAVLPFNDRSTDASLGTLAGTLSDELVRGLSQGSLLSVISTNGVLQMREQGTPEDSLGRMLGADYLVGGSVTRYGDQMRMDVELLDGRTGQVLRTGVFERPWSESRNLVEDVVRAAALFLRGELGTRLELARVQAGTANEDAWRLVVEAKAAQRPIVTLLKAREFPVALSILQRADSMLEAAARLDTEWVEPVVERGWVSERQALIARFTGDLELQRNRLDEALRHARRAAEMKSDYAGAYALRGSILHLLSLLPQPAAEATAALTAAEDDLRRAAELDPLDQPALRRLADLLYSIGKYGEAKAAAESAFRIDPYSPDAAGLTYQLFSTSFETGLDSEADGWCFQGRKQFPDELIFVYCLLALHAWADGLEPEPDQLRIELGNFQQGERRLQPDLMSRFETMIAAAYARAGQPDSAYAILDRIAATSADRGALWMRASVYAALGEDSTALYLLNEYRVYGGWRAVRVVESRPFWNLNERTGIRRVNSRDKSRP